MIAFILGNFLRSLMSMMINKLVIKISHKNRKSLRPKKIKIALLKFLKWNKFKSIKIN